ncbi:MAG: ABC transporter permease [Helicobacter sp.]|nr:ABC transporter permease [Helicobacter sp.]MCI7484738.1 ABC transporter permease [Helicobacter sp.]
MNTPRFSLGRTNLALKITFSGEWNYTTPKQTLKNLRNIIRSTNTIIELEFLEDCKVDFAICSLLKYHLQGKRFLLHTQDSNISKIFALLEDFPQDTPTYKQPNIFLSFYKDLNLSTQNFFTSMIDFMNFFGMWIYYFCLSFRHPSRFKIASIFYHISESGIRALPIVLITSFIVSYAIAMQGVIQLDKMGAPLMSVEIIGKLSLRELGPFILALVVAGRSASSFSAQIGVMNLTEENDALKTMGFSVIDFLVTPRIIALVITMPLLVFLADLVSLISGMLALNVQAGISFTQYWERFYEYVSITNFFIGIVKAPFFGVAIALVGCFRGLKVHGDTESLGKQTTLSVVNAIFWVIVINAIFSFFTTSLGI